MLRFKVLRFLGSALEPRRAAPWTSRACGVALRRLWRPQLRTL